MADFSFYEENEFEPVYEGIDFYQIKVDTLREQGYVPYECWFVINDENENYSQQVHQLNTFVELNAIAPHMDRITVQDNRDENCWIWFRDDLGEDQFNRVIDQIGDYAEVTHTMYPYEHVVKNYLARKLGKLAVELEQKDE